MLYLYKLKYMNLKEHIKKKYKSQYAFAEQKGLKASLVSYWCSKKWEHLTYKTRNRILNYLK